jgi:hypothetical protein
MKDFWEREELNGATESSVGTIAFLWYACISGQENLLVIIDSSGTGASSPCSTASGYLLAILCCDPSNATY